MATVEQILKEARHLSVEERRRLRVALERLDLNVGAPENSETQLQESQSPCLGNVDDKTRERRLEWLKSHREEYGGQYVALDGERLLAVGPNYRIAKEKALAAGKAGAFVTYLPKPDEVAEMGGWR